ncbi:MULTISPECIES: helicase-related protein [unclassified Sphingomonas]|uniref:helicase-related protein n=1 Tax=unclassified Sphingomonas TaxID=196159 RepID=UPI000BDC889C|nr:MAG: helicase [Sphingomonas sp. 32-62-10]
MTGHATRPVTAVLGPTNTGKTHLAIERMCGHSSGMIGFPLRLLAREVYDRVVKIKGAGQVALITGEEKIVPRDARWFLCTAESMPIDKDLAFVGIDEAQLGADAERGHVFTDRLLRARGREETMVLGSEALRPMIKTLVPDADILSRPRFSTLSYAGARKISRLPKRSVIVAFSAEEVYAVAEMLRRLRGGAAVVMGALSPRTRNAQVAMFQAGEVDYLVATDAIGMGLNMDVAHVAFASLRKFDGHRQRRLTVAEMAQIAGRAGRHQRDGTFGALSEEGPGAFTPEEVLAIEEHRFPRLEHLYWRNGQPATASIDDLVADLEQKPLSPVLRAAPESIDLAVLKRLAEEDGVRARTRGSAMVNRFWAACGLPDFRKLGVDPHTRFVARVYGHLSEGTGHIPHDWFAAEIARLDNVAGDVETIAGRIAAARSWAYIANRADWMADPAHWADRTRALEERLSDALHDRLTQRFVDRRTTVLMRQLGADASALAVTVADDGSVLVEDQLIGRLEGFRFVVAADARASDKRLLLAAAEKRLGGERARRGGALAEAAESALSLAPGDQPAIVWSGWTVGVLKPGASLARPRIELDRALDCLDPALRERVRTRLEGWVAAQLARHVAALVAMEAIGRDPTASAPLRVVAATLVQGAGLAARLPLGDAIDGLQAGDRQRLRKAGIVIGALDLFDPRLLKPGAARWRQALIAARSGASMPPLPLPGATVLARGVLGNAAAFGFREIGGQAVRVDLVERIARAAHEARAGKAPFAPDSAMATSIGLAPATMDRLMAQLGFRAAEPEAGVSRWVWRGRPARVKSAIPAPRDNAFAALRHLTSGQQG